MVKKDDRDPASYLSAMHRHRHFLRKPIALFLGSAELGPTSDPRSLIPSRELISSPGTFTVLKVPPFRCQRFQ
jgi:hypothetical protein